MVAGADAGALPPEVNYNNLVLGDQMLSTTLAGAAHESLGKLLAVEMGRQGMNTAVTLAEWIGLGGVAMGMTSAQLEAMIALLEAWFEAGGAALLEISATYHATVTGMIPSPVCLTNRADQAGLVATNFLGFNTPAINGLDALYASHWVQNAALTGSFEALAAATIATLTVPAPLTPPMSNPAAVAQGTAASVAQTAGTNALQQGFEQLSSAPAAVGNSSGSASSLPGADSLQSVLPMMMQSATQFSSVANPQQLSQLPQMFSQGAGQFGSLLAPMLNPGALGAGLNPGTVAPVGNVLSAGSSVGSGIGAGPGGAGIVPPATTYTRPVSNFSAPNSPQLPGAWKAMPRPGEGAVAGQGFGGGGLYGAPPMAGMRPDGSSQQSQERGRTMSVAARRTI